MTEYMGPFEKEEIDTVFECFDGNDKLFEFYNGEDSKVGVVENIESICVESTLSAEDSVYGTATLKIGFTMRSGQFIGETLVAEAYSIENCFDHCLLSAADKRYITENMKGILLTFF